MYAAFKRRFEDVVQRAIIVLDLILAERLDDDSKKEQRKLLMCKLFRATILNNELEKFIPLLVRN